MISKLLMERIHDKEALVRTHAVTALSRLQVIFIILNAKGCGDKLENQRLVNSLLDVLEHDPHA